MSVRCFKHVAYERFLRGGFNAKIAKIIAKNAMTISSY
jgi:hypothetical protein